MSIGEDHSLALPSNADDVNEQTILGLPPSKVAAATFLALCALAKRLTGEELCIGIAGLGDQPATIITGVTGRVTWVSDRPSEKQSISVDREARRKRPYAVSQEGVAGSRSLQRSHPRGR